jgi:acyl transferase domain-containing protein
MAPIAVTPDNSSTASPSGESVNGYFHVTNGLTNGHSNGYTNGHANGATNGCSNGLPDGPSGSRKSMPIAIVGMACRMPGNVATPAEFWELCTRARSGWTEIPKTRFDNTRFHHPNPGKGGTLNPIGGNFLNVDLAAFDAPFFGLTEKEAISMDPQQRLLLECTFEALENAGIPKHTIVGKNVGVFIGGSFPEYESHLFRDSDTIPMHQATGGYPHDGASALWRRHRF